VYLTEHRIEPRDTRAYAGLLQRLAWRCRRWVERQLAYSRGDVLTYKVRARSHQDDDLGPTYRRRLRQESIWLNGVWTPLARILDIATVVSDYDNEALPGDKAILRWLDRHPNLVHASAGGPRNGVYLEWYSLSHAPWSGQREDWLLWTEDDGTQDVDGPLSQLQAQEIYLDYEADYRRLQQLEFSRWNDVRYADERFDDDLDDVSSTDPRYFDDDEYDSYMRDWPLPVNAPSMASAYVNSPSTVDELTDEDEEMIQQWRDEYHDDLLREETT
jgi:hypothetical protein